MHYTAQLSLAALVRSTTPKPSCADFSFEALKVNLTLRIPSKLVSSDLPNGNATVITLGVLGVLHFVTSVDWRLSW